MSSTGAFTVDLNSSGNQGSGNYYDITVYDSNMEALSFRKGSGVEWREGDLAFDVMASTSGLYYIEVADSTYHTTEAYDLSVVQVTSPLYDYETEVNNLLNSTADIMTFGKGMYGSLLSSSDVDYYKLDITTPGVINLDFLSKRLEMIIILMSSNIFSMIVCNRLAPIFSTVVFTSEAILAIASIPSSENSKSTFSVFNNATYCLIKLKSGSLKILLKSSLVNASNSTLIGNLPCNSGNRSEGLASWNAPDAINKI